MTAKGKCIVCIIIDIIDNSSMADDSQTLVLNAL